MFSSSGYLSSSLSSIDLDLPGSSLGTSDGGYGPPSILVAFDLLIQQQLGAFLNCSRYMESVIVEQVVSSCNVKFVYPFSFKQSLFSAVTTLGDFVLH